MKNILSILVILFTQSICAQEDSLSKHLRLSVACYKEILKKTDEFTFILKLENISNQDIYTPNQFLAFPDRCNHPGNINYRFESLDSFFSSNVKDCDVDVGFYLRETPLKRLLSQYSSHLIEVSFFAERFYPLKPGKYRIRFYSNKTHEMYNLPPLTTDWVEFEVR